MSRPIPGDYIFNALRDRQCIVMACNTRIIKGVTRGIFRAAKKLDSAVIIEIARSECDQNGGYIGLTPVMFAEMIKKIADEVGHDIWALHADHIGIKKGDAEDIAQTKQFIKAQIDAGFTSFAIDASHLFNFNGSTVYEELEPNINATIEIGKFILENMKGRDFGLEVEVGEIGRKNEKGMVLTTPEEAVVFISSLNKAGLFPQVLAIANGSEHGNVYDECGKQIKKLSINSERTKEISRALRNNNLNVRIAQHGISGTPREMIYAQFPHGDIVKGNVATFWQNMFHEIIKVHCPELFTEIVDWTIISYKEAAKKAGIKTEEEIFGKYGKFATKQFFNRIYSIDEEAEQAVEAMAYAEALTFFKAFRSKGTAEIVRRYLSSK